MIDLFGRLKKNSKIAIFGAGQAGVDFYNELEEKRKDVEVEMFVDTYKQGEICGKKIVKFLSFAEKHKEFDYQHLVIASMYHDEIESHLKNHGIFNYFVFHAQPGSPDIPQVEKLFPALSFQIFQYEMVEKKDKRAGLSSHFKLASIIVLVYNNIEFTTRSLESLVYCTHFPYELIIVDNGSDLRMKQWLNGFIRNHKDKNIKLLSLNPEQEWSRQKKIYFAKNIALETAQGDLLVINDNDLAYKPFWLHYAVFLLGMFPEAGLLGLQRYKGKTHRVLDSMQRHGVRVLSMNTVEGCNLILSRSVYDKIGNFKEEPQSYDAPFSNYKGCDVEFTYRIRDQGLLCIVPERDVIRHIQQPRRYN